MNKFRKPGFVAYNRGALSVHSSLLDVLLSSSTSERKSPPAGLCGLKIFLKREQF